VNSEIANYEMPGLENNCYANEEEAAAAEKGEEGIKRDSLVTFGGEEACMWTEGGEKREPIRNSKCLSGEIE